MEDAISLALRQIKDNLSTSDFDNSVDPSKENTDDPREIKPETDITKSDTASVEHQTAEKEPVSHLEAVHSVQQKMADLIRNDPLLYDLPTEVTLEEINSCIALEYGQAMIVNVRKADDEVMAIVVTQNATVLDLKHAIKRHVMLKQSRTGGKPHISWSYVWKRYWLYYEGQKLTQDNTMLKDYGIRNKEEVSFMKKLKER